MERSPKEEKINFILLIAKSLHACGAAAHHIEMAISAISERLRMTTNLMSFPTGIISSFSFKDGDENRMIRVQPGGVDLYKMSRIDETVEQIYNKRLTIDEGTIAVEKIMKQPPNYPLWLTILSFGVAAGGISICFVASFADFIVSFLLGILIGFCSYIFPHFPKGEHLFVVFVSFVSSVIASIVALYIETLSANVVTMASLIVLIPGLSLILSLVEISTKNLISGTARFVGATMEMALMVFSVVAGRKLVEYLGPVGVTYVYQPLEEWCEYLALIGLGISFSIIFKVRKRDLIWSFLMAFCGYLIVKFGVKHFGPELAFFLVGAFIKAGSNLFARLLNRPALITILPGIILLVPGSVTYKSIRFVFESEIMSGVNSAFAVVVIAVSLVAGLLFGSILINQRKGF